MIPKTKTAADGCRFLDFSLLEEYFKWAGQSRAIWVSWERCADLSVERKETNSGGFASEASCGAPLRPKGA
jgi:hypothetical protein